MTQGAETSWYALRTLPQREQIVRKYLIHKGHQAFTKLERRFGRWSKGKRTEKEYVAAPGYVFLGIAGSPWAMVHGCHLIRSVVSYNGAPAKLQPQGLAEFLGFDDFSSPDYYRFFREAPFAIGDMVRIDTPSLQGFERQVKDIRRGEAIFDLVMLGRTVEVAVPVAECYKAA